jgi:hypothetical protein
MVLTAGFFARLGMSSDVVPTRFLEARQGGSEVSQEIVELSNRFSGELAEINRLDQEKKYAEALDLTTNMVQRIPEMRNKATDLTKELDKMTSSLLEIQSEEARQAAVNAITNRMALIGRLFSYSDYLLQLSQALQDRFVQRPNYQSVEELTTRINSEVQAVNIFNKEASEAMDRFDQIMTSGK